MLLALYPVQSQLTAQLQERPTTGIIEVQVPQTAKLARQQLSAANGQGMRPHHYYDAAAGAISRQIPAHVETYYTGVGKNHASVARLSSRVP